MINCFILADDMGLGKTLTMIALVLKSNEKKLLATENTEETDDEDVENEENTQNWITSSKEKSKVINFSIISETRSLELQNL